MKSTSTMTTRTRIETIILYVVFAFYILFLLKLMIFSRVSSPDARSINLIPFASIKAYLLGGSATLTRFAFSNVAGNIIAFMPLGAYLPLFRSNKSTLRNLLVILIASLVIELIQGTFGIGTADIDDIILNCLGGLIGIWGYKLLVRIFRSEKRAHTAMTIVSAMGLPILLYYLFIIKLRL